MIYDITELPTAYFSENVNANALRNELIKNQVRVPECNQGDLETFFFSNENIDLINKQLILSVYEKSKNTIQISSQSTESLIIVMRYIYIEYARHLPYNIAQQIRELNCRVVSDILPNIITNVTQRIDYLNEIEKPRQINTLAQNVNNNIKKLPGFSTIIHN
jgi:aspartyl-tRNA synthetase